MLRVVFQIFSFRRWAFCLLSTIVLSATAVQEVVETQEPVVAEPGTQDVLTLGEGVRWIPGLHLNFARIDFGSPRAPEAGPIAGAMGVGFELMGRFPGHHGLRFVMDYQGTRIPDRDPPPLDPPEVDTDDLFRTLSFGAEHILRVRSGDQPGWYAFYGGGVRKSWVSRVHGSIGFTIFEFFLSAFGEDNTFDPDYSVQKTHLRAWNPFLSAGFGVGFDSGGYLEFRYLRGRYARFEGSGLSLDGVGRIQERTDEQWVFCVGLRIDE